MPRLWNMFVQGPLEKGTKTCFCGLAKRGRRACGPQHLLTSVVEPIHVVQAAGVRRLSLFKMRRAKSLAL
jgi:hypothetical protein